MESARAERRNAIEPESIHFIDISADVITDTEELKSNIEGTDFPPALSVMLSAFREAEFSGYDLSFPVEMIQYRSRPEGTKKLSSGRKPLRW
jgi:hypothetical protein